MYSENILVRLPAKLKKQCMEVFAFKEILANFIFFAGRSGLGWPGGWQQWQWDAGVPHLLPRGTGPRDSRDCWGTASWDRFHVLCSLCRLEFVLNFLCFWYYLNIYIFFIICIFFLDVYFFIAFSFFFSYASLSTFYLIVISFLLYVFAFFWCSSVGCMLSNVWKSSLSHLAFNKKSITFIEKKYPSPVSLIHFSCFCVQLGGLCTSLVFLSYCCWSHRGTCWLRAVPGQVGSDCTTLDRPGSRL